MDWIRLGYISYLRIWNYACAREALTILETMKMQTKTLTAAQKRLILWVEELSFASQFILNLAAQNCNLRLEDKCLSSELTIGSSAARGPVPKRKNGRDFKSVLVEARQKLASGEQHGEELITTADKAKSLIQDVHYQQNGSRTKFWVLKKQIKRVFQASPATKHEFLSRVSVLVKLERLDEA